MQRGQRTGCLHVLGLAFLLAAMPAAAQKPRAERPTYTVGEKWIRSDGTFDLTRIEKDLYIFSAGPGREIHITRDLAVARFLRAQQVVEFDPPPKLKWPLEVGKWGADEVIWRTPDFPSGIRARVTWSVDAYEDVRVPAGTFKAFRISLSATPAEGRFEQRWPERTGKIWYAPEARQFVKAEGRVETAFSDFQLLALDRPVMVPLQVVLNQPRDQAHATSENMLLAGKVSAGKGITRVSITLNGQEISTQGEERTPKTEMGLQVPLKLRVGKNVVLVTATDTTGDILQEARTLYYDKGVSPGTGPAASSGPGTPIPPPLQVTLSSPRDQVRTHDESIAVAGTVSGGRGVSRVVIAVNGVEVAHWGEATPQTDLPISVPVKLREGQNTLVLTATDAAGILHQEVRIVTYEPARASGTESRSPR